MVASSSQILKILTRHISLDGLIQIRAKFADIILVSGTHVQKLREPSMMDSAYLGQQII